MTDLSGYSDADIMKAAGVAPAAPPAPDPSQYSDAAVLGAIPPHTFNVLPLSQDAQGNTHFDINAGLPGALIRAFTAPGDVYAGRLDPMSPEGQARAREMASVISPSSVAMRAGEQAIPGLALSPRRATPPVPTAAELQAATTSGYNAARATGAEYPGSAVSDLASTAQTGMQTDGILAELAPQTFSVLKQLQNPPEGSVVTIASLDAARKALGRIGGNFQNPTEQEAARRVTQRIDDFIQNSGAGAGAGAVPGSGVPGPGAGAPGPGLSVPPVAPVGPSAANGAGAGGVAEDPLTQAARLIREARANAAANFRSGRITDAEDAADLRAAATNSGQNGGNAIRQRLASLLNSDKQSRGYSPAELDAIRQVAQGTVTANTLRRVGNMLGGGGGLGQTAISALGAAGGAAVDGAAGAGIGAAALPAVGAASRSAYNALVARQVQSLSELMRMRSPLYQQRVGGLLPSRWDQGLGLGTRGMLTAGQQQGLLDDPTQR